MALTSGTRLGPYEIVSPVGAGGMGEVYKARDTRLDRTVAIKIVAPLIAAAPDVRARLEREARAISQLNHPHICSLYDVGREGVTDYLVLEYLEGQTLAERLQKGPLPIDEAMRIASQVCDALERAHRAGLVHRDLKPANIMLTREGAKLLDFGLAKTSAPAAATATMTVSPLTSQGTILGTLHYMSPEQVEGRDADARSDVFSFGAVMYEMVAGRRAFAGDSAASVMTAILRDAPPRMDTLLPIVPVSLDRIVRRCLEKDPDDRWQSARDILLLLRENALLEPSPPAATRARRGVWPVAMAASVALVAFAVAAWQWNAGRGAAEPPAFHLDVGLPDGFQFYRDTPELALSRDGRHLAASFVEPAGTQRIYVRAMHDTAWKPVAGTEGAMQPFWSPDARRIGFFAAGRLKHVAMDGGPVQDVAAVAVSEPRGGVWLADDTILLTPNPNAGVVLVRASGGKVEAITTPADGESHRFPSALPDGRRFLFWQSGLPEVSGVYVASIDGGEPKRLVRAETRGVYADGFLVYVRDGALLAQPFDPDTEKVGGEPLVLAASVDFGGPPGSAAFAVAARGLVAYCSGGQFALRNVVRRSRDGKELARFWETRRYSAIALSSDGRRIAVSMHERVGRPGLWVIDAARGVGTRVTDEVGAWFPLWTPDQRLFFRRGLASSGASVVHQTLNGAERATDAALFPVSATPDGATVLGHETDSRTGWDVLALRDGKLHPVVATPYADVHPALSPDGRWLAWMSDESGAFEVYVAQYPDLQDKQRVSISGGGQPSWRGDGTELFFVGNNKLMSVSVDATAGLRLGSAQPLFDVTIAAVAVPYARLYAPANDGLSFVLLEPDSGGPRATLRVLSGIRTR